MNPPHNGHAEREEMKRGMHSNVDAPEETAQLDNERNQYEASAHPISRHHGHYTDGRKSNIQVPTQQPPQASISEGHHLPKHHHNYSSPHSHHSHAPHGQTHPHNDYYASNSGLCQYSTIG